MHPILADTLRLRLLLVAWALVGAMLGLLVSAFIPGVTIGEGLLFGLTPLDLTTYAMVAAGFAAVALAAAYLPARRAARVDPIAALRQRSFLIFLVGSLVSNTGNQMRTVAVGWEVWRRTGDELSLDSSAWSSRCP